MTILALEFSSDRRSAAIARDGEVLAESVEATAGRGTNAFHLIGQVLDRTRIAREEIEVIAIGIGPGSYTGIRAAIAIAQGWQLARGVKLLGISSAEALAAQARAAGMRGRVNVVIDAQRNEFYLARLEITDAAIHALAPLCIVSSAEIAALQQDGSMCVGPEMPSVLHPAAAMVAGLAVRQSNFIDGSALEPIYLRETSFVKAPPARIID